MEPCVGVQSLVRAAERIEQRQAFLSVEQLIFELHDEQHGDVDGAGRSR